jgi:alpha-galactosidase
MQHPKVVVIGAGSLFFGRQSLWNMLHSGVLRKGTLAYVDTDKSRLDRMVALGKVLVRHLGSPLAIEGSTDRKKVLDGADFVVLSFANEGVKYRGVDCRIAEKYGVLMCSGDTIGPGGIFRAARELPEILRVAKDVKRLCPDAWVINYINPTTVNGIGLMRHAPGVKSFAMCDGFHMPMWKRNFMVRAGVAADAKDITSKMEKDCDVRHAGINHFPWLLSATYKGRDVTPALRRDIEKRAAAETAEGHSKEVFNSRYALELWDVFGLCPLNLAHTKEYVRYWQGKNIAPGRLPALKVFDAVERQKRHDAMWQEVDSYLSGARPLEHFMTNHSQDHATDVIESMWGGLKKRFVVSSPNRGAVPNMDDDAFLELLCDIDMKGPRPLKAGSLPTGIRAMEQTVLETHELTVEAIVKCDRGLLRRAMCLDPMVASIEDADAMIAELLEAEREALPKGWFR